MTENWKYWFLSWNTQVFNGLVQKTNNISQLLPNNLHPVISVHWNKFKDRIVVAKISDFCTDIL